MAATAELVEAVKAHALRNYNKGGWDVIVECWSDEQIAEVIEARGSLGEGLGRPVTSVVRAIKRFRPTVSVFADREADAVNSAF